jgi:hypothetical protein
MLVKIAVAQQAREALKLFPQAIADLRARITKAEAEIAEMEKANGFGQEAPARPGSQGTQPEAEPQYEAPAAFRGQQ